MHFSSSSIFCGPFARTVPESSQCVVCTDGSRSGTECGIGGVVLGGHLRTAFFAEARAAAAANPGDSAFAVKAAAAESEATQTEVRVKADEAKVIGAVAQAAVVAKGTAERKAASQTRRPRQLRL